MNNSPIRIVILIIGVINILCSLTDFIGFSDLHLVAQVFQCIQVPVHIWLCYLVWQNSRNGFLGVFVFYIIMTLSIPGIPEYHWFGWYILFYPVVFYLNDSHWSLGVNLVALTMVVLSWVQFKRLSKSQEPEPYLDLGEDLR
jgi:hypothetical protein